MILFKIRTQKINLPLHAAAVFWNPFIMYSLKFKIDLRMRNGLHEAMLRMATEDRIKSGITKEYPVYLNAQGALGTEFSNHG